MGSVFTFGSYSHAESEVAFASIRREVILSQTQRPHILRESWSMKGRIVGVGSDPQAMIFSTLNALRDAYARPANYAGMSLPGGSIRIGSASVQGCIGENGQTVLVTSPISHGPIQGANGATFLEYTFGLQCDSFLSNVTELLSYSETVTYSDIGGRPLMVYRVPIAGLPVAQAVSTSSWFECTQSGYASSRDQNIKPEDMLFPGFLKGQPGSAVVSYHSPKTVRGTETEYGIQWTYQYISPVPLYGSYHHRG